MSSRSSSLLAAGPLLRLERRQARLRRPGAAASAGCGRSAVAAARGAAGAAAARAADAGDPLDQARHAALGRGVPRRAAAPPAGPAGGASGTGRAGPDRPAAAR